MVSADFLDLDLWRELGIDPSKQCHAMSEAIEYQTSGESLAALLRLCSEFDVFECDECPLQVAALGALACMHRIHAHPLGPMTSFYACSAYNLADKACSQIESRQLKLLRRDAAVAAMAAVLHSPHVRKTMYRKLSPLRLQLAVEAENACLPLDQQKDMNADVFLCLRAVVEKQVHTFMVEILNGDSYCEKIPTFQELDWGPPPKQLVSPEFCKWLALREFEEQATTALGSRQGFIDGYRFFQHGFYQQAACIFRGLYKAERDRPEQCLAGVRGLILSVLMAGFVHAEFSTPQEKRRIDYLTRNLEELDPRAEGKLSALLWCCTAATQWPSERFEYIKSAYQLIDTLSSKDQRPLWLKPKQLETLEKMLERP